MPFKQNKKRNEFEKEKGKEKNVQHSLFAHSQARLCRGKEKIDGK